MQTYFNRIDCIHYAVHYIPVTHLFCNWKFASSNLSHIYHFFAFSLFKIDIKLVYNLILVSCVQQNDLIFVHKTK